MPEQNTTTASSTAWRSGRFDERQRHAQLLFGQMWEDAAIECELFSPCENVFTIASAGCTALALARHGCRVTACDINPRQVDYVERRSELGPIERGRAEKLLTIFRMAATCVGLTPRIRREFASLDNLTQQTEFWKKRFDCPRVRRLLRWLLHPRLLRSTYAPKFIQSLPHDFSEVLWKRLTRGFSTHPNRHNPFAWRLLLGNDPSVSESIAMPGIMGVCADACEYLEGCRPQLFSGLSFSNILDGASPEYAARLGRAVRHAATPDATVVLRSFSEPRTVKEDEWATRDRSLLWGRVIVCRPSEFSVQ
jgi:S-adenosylmethionine:diacylglycerol 3-amino-3-carboxypropyl transferase